MRVIHISIALIILNASVTLAQSRGILVHVALAGDLGEAVRSGRTQPTCSQFRENGKADMTVTEVKSSDEILVALSQDDTLDTCKTVPIGEGGVKSDAFIRILLLGYRDEADSYIEIKNAVIREQIRRTIEGRRSILRLPVEQLLTYKTAEGETRYAQHGQIFRVMIDRERVKLQAQQTDSDSTPPAQNSVADQAPVTQPDSTEGQQQGGQESDKSGDNDITYHMHWDFKLQRSPMATRIQVLTIWSYTFQRDEPNTWRALPVAVATGVRFGINTSFPRYLDWTLFVAPGIRLGGSDEESSAAVTSAIIGTHLAFADYFGVGGGIDWQWGENASARPVFVFSVSPRILSLFTASQ